MLTTLSAIPPTRVWKDVLARVIHGEQLTLAVVELPPGGLVPEHRHVNEQIGLCLHGTLTFRVGQETRDLGPAAPGASSRTSPMRSRQDRKARSWWKRSPRHATTGPGSNRRPRPRRAGLPPTEARQDHQPSPSCREARPWTGTGLGPAVNQRAISLNPAWSM